MLRLKIQTDCIQCFENVGWVTDIVSSLKKLSVGVDCWWSWFDWSFAHLRASVVITTTSYYLLQQQSPGWCDIMVHAYVVFLETW